MAMTGEHPADVLNRIAEWQDAQLDCALIVVSHTEGGAVRAPGALFAVNERSSFGYISGGCIDADVVLQARQAIADDQSRALRYGAGSPFVDLPLPCGGAIEVMIVPNPDANLINRLCCDLDERRPVCLTIASDGSLVSADAHLFPSTGRSSFHYYPKLRLRIAGRGADAMALAKISDAAGFEVRLQLPDDDDIDEARNAHIQQVEKLTTSSGLPPLDDDPWTAFVLLFHDRDWEIPLLKQAMSGSAFYVGAVGSQRTHGARCEELRNADCSERDIARIHGPVGLVPSLRDASLIALSTLAEIIQVSTRRATPRKTGFVMLAAGASSRFERGDKMLASLDSEPVLHHAAKVLASFPTARPIAVIDPGNDPRGDILKYAGWKVVENEQAQTGQSSSLVCALQHLNTQPEIDQIMILLGDMPKVPAIHLKTMLSVAQDETITAVMSECDGILCPPALFKRKHFEALTNLTGDRGAKSVFLDIGTGTKTIKLSPDNGIDIDQEADLIRAMEAELA